MTATGSYAPQLLELLIDGVIPLNISNGIHQRTQLAITPLSISNGTTQQTFQGIQKLNIVANKQFVYVPKPTVVAVGNFNINRIRIDTTNTINPRIKIYSLVTI